MWFVLVGWFTHTNTDTKKALGLPCITLVPVPSVA